LGAGHSESVYENALKLEIDRHGLECQQQVVIPIMDCGIHVGEFVVDLVVADSVLVELKARPTLTPENESKLLQYLKQSNFQVGLLLNFGRSVTIRRKVNTQTKS
jgi:GxxExxY protein